MAIEFIKTTAEVSLWSAQELSQLIPLCGDPQSSDIHWQIRYFDPDIVDGVGSTELSNWADHSMVDDHFTFPRSHQEQSANQFEWRYHLSSHCLRNSWWLVFLSLSVALSLSLSMLPSPKIYSLAGIVFNKDVKWNWKVLFHCDLMNCTVATWIICFLNAKLTIFFRTTSNRWQMTSWCSFTGTKWKSC